MTPWQYTLAAMGKREHEPCTEEEYRLATAIEKAITNAFAEERERCAQIAERQPIYPDTHTGLRQELVRKQIAAGIRASV